MENKNTKKLGFGLKPSTYDPRDFSHAKVFGMPKREQLPENDFFVSEPLEIKDQKQTDFCTAYAASAVSEDQENVPLCPEYTFMAAKRILGKNAWKEWGLELRDICRAACKYGFLEKDHYPFIGMEVDRDFLANPANWKEESDILAEDHKKQSFFDAVDGPYDTFDNLRATLFKNAAEKRSILTGVNWRYAWNTAEKGIIPRAGWENEAGEGHAVKVFGQIKLDDPENPGKKALYLIVQNSWGDDSGDNGLFYFPREVVNKEFVFGAFTFSDMPREQAEYHSENGISVNDTTGTKIRKVITNFLKALIGK